MLSVAYDSSTVRKGGEKRMKKLGLLALAAIFGSLMVSMMASASFVVNTAHASPLPPAFVAGDLNNDGQVNLTDLVGFAGIYGLTSASPRWNTPIVTVTGWNNVSSADFNNDSRIDLADLITLAYCYALNSTI